MADRPEVVRGHPDELPEDLPFLKRPEGDPTPFDRELLAEGLRSGRNKQTAQQSLFSDAALAEEQSPAIEAARRSLSQAPDKHKTLTRPGKDILPEIDPARRRDVIFDLWARAVMERFCKICAVTQEVSIMAAQNGLFDEAMLTELTQGLPSHGQPPVQGAVAEWIRANDAGDPTTREAGVLWKAYTEKVEAFSAYVTASADKTQPPDAEGRITIKPADVDEVKRQRDQVQTLLKQFLSIVQHWHTERTATKSAAEYPCNTTQEIAALNYGLSDGKSKRYYRFDEQAKSATHQRPNSPHYLTIGLTSDELKDGHNIRTLENLIERQDVDAVFTVYYILGLLIPENPLPVNAAPAVWVSIDDIIKKIGWEPRSAKEREEARQKIHSYLVFVSRASVTGVRRGLARDPDTRQNLQTRIDAPLWSFGARERAIQPSLLESYETPLKVELLVSREWLPFLTDPRLKQFLPFGERVAVIAPDQPRGAWARVIGITLLHFWRRNPRETIERLRFPTRRELITAYTPKTAPAMEILTGKNPIRALQYWEQALEQLVEQNILAWEGEAKTPNATERPRKNWQDDWLDETVILIPHPDVLAHLAPIQRALPPLKPTNLTAKPRRKKTKKQE